MLGSGGTPTPNTGPFFGAIGTGYVYVEATNNYNSDFGLEKSIPQGHQLYGMSFRYHMYGAGMGTTILEGSTDGSAWVSLWSKSGNMGAQWKQATVYAGSGQTMLRFMCVPSGHVGWKLCVVTVINP